MKDTFTDPEVAETIVPDPSTISVQVAQSSVNPDPNDTFTIPDPIRVITGGVVSPCIPSVILNTLVEYHPE